MLNIFSTENLDDCDLAITETQDIYVSVIFLYFYLLKANYITMKYITMIIRQQNYEGGLLLSPLLLSSFKLY